LPSDPNLLHPSKGCGSSCEVPVSFEVPVLFQDMTVDISREEWQDLDPVQRCLYWDVTLENYNRLLSAGYQVSKPEAIFPLEQGQGPWTLEGDAHEVFNSQTCPYRSSSNSSTTVRFPTLVLVPSEGSTHGFLLQ
uniref:KRAB domain-containing protein n=1 Tax=Prolemur simus TaxID=1328070 RepID=A0A8C9AVE5_PROSS